MSNSSSSMPSFSNVSPSLSNSAPSSYFRESETIGEIRYLNAQLEQASKKMKYYKKRSRKLHHQAMNLHEENVILLEQLRSARKDTQDLKEEIRTEHSRYESLWDNFLKIARELKEIKFPQNS